MKYFIYRENQTQQEREAELESMRQHQRNTWEAMPESERKERGAAIAAKAKMKKQFESENDTICRQKFEAATKKITRCQRYELLHIVINTYNHIKYYQIFNSYCQ